MAAREAQAEVGEAIIERTRSAQPNNGSVRVNLTNPGKDILGIEPQDQLTVQVFQDHIRIYPEE